MHRWYLFRLGIAVTLLTLTFAVPTVSLAQSTIDLVVHYVEGIPAENDIAYQVSVYLSVVDSTGNPVKNLASDALTVTEDSQKVAIENLSLGGEEPINIILVMDTSGSMGGAGITDAKTAASNFIAGMKSGDRVAIVTFDNTVKTQIDFTTDHQAVRNQISLIDAVRGAGTCMYDAAYQAVQMASTLPSGRRAVVLFTDGVDTESFGASYDSTLRDAAEADALIFPIYYNTFLATRGIGGGNGPMRRWPPPHRGRARPPTTR